MEPFVQAGALALVITESRAFGCQPAGQSPKGVTGSCAFWTFNRDVSVERVDLRFNPR